MGGFANGVGYYYNPTTGFSYGPDLSTNYAPNPGGSLVVTNSQPVVTQYVTTDLAQTDHTYSTTLDALLNGHSVFDMTFALPYSDAVVQAAVTQADALLAAGGASPSSPSLASSLLTALGSRTSTVQTGQATDGSVTSSTTTFGPGTIGPGDSVPVSTNGVTYDPKPTSPYYFFVRPGQTDINIATTTTTIDQTVTTTTTDLLTQTYDIVGTSNGTGAASAVPEPAPVALLALGLLPVGVLVARRRKGKTA